MSRILFLVSSMQGGGAERVAALLCSHWAEQGHEVVLVPTFSGRGECLYPLHENVRLEYLADRVGNTRGFGQNKLWRLWVLRRMIREKSPHVIVSFLPHVNVAAVIAATKLPTRVVVAERSYPPMMSSSRVLRTLRRLTYRYADAVVMQTVQGQRWARRVCVGSHTEVIANPLIWPLAVYEPRIAPEHVVTPGHNVLLAVGRLSEEKQPNRIIDAFAQLATQYPDWDLVLLGDGVERLRLETQRKAIGLIERIHLPGRVGNLADWYHRASLYVLSSRFEGFPNTLLEAMAHGLPAVSVDCDTGPRDMIRPGVDGTLVAPESGAPGLRDALAELMGQPARRSRFGEAATEIRQRYAMSRIAADWRRVLMLA